MLMVVSGAREAEVEQIFEKWIFTRPLWVR